VLLQALKGFRDPALRGNEASGEAALRRTTRWSTSSIVDKRCEADMLEYEAETDCRAAAEKRAGEQAEDGMNEIECLLTRIPSIAP
jgi:hypothetical protein